MRQRKRARVTAVPPSSVFAAAAAELALAKKRKLREAPSLDALPDACLFEILRRVQGARARGASACVSRRWLALLGGIRASEIKRAVPDLNQVFVADEEEEEDLPACCSERSLEGEGATDVALTAAAVRGNLESLVVRGSHPTRGVTDTGISAVARGCSSLRSLALWDVPQVTDAGLAEIAAGCPRWRSSTSLAAR